MKPTAYSYLPRFLENPDQVPIEDIPQAIDATQNTIAALRIALQRRFDPINGPRALQHAEEIQNKLKQRLLDYVQDVKSLPRIDIVLYEQQNGPMDHHVLFASANHLTTDEEKAAFSISGALSKVDKTTKVLRDVYELILKIIAVTAPVTGIKPRGALSNAAFQRVSVINKDAASKPDAFYMQLFTPSALSLIEQHKRLREQNDEDGIKALQSDSNIRFFARNDYPDVKHTSELGIKNCRTQRQEGIASLVVGEGRGKIWLWKDNTVLTWRIKDDTFNTQEMFTTVETAMQASTAAWNLIRPGGVTFQRSQTEEDATFTVRYIGNLRGIEAAAFGPAIYVKGVSALLIFDDAFSAGRIRYLSNNLCHELGHILGFRHEFALLVETYLPAGRYGGRDPRSVMGYALPLVITVLDVANSRSAYNYFQGDGSFFLDDERGNRNEFKVTRRDP